MSLILTNPTQWCDNYDVASERERYSLLLEALEQPLTPQLIEQSQLGMWLVDFIDTLNYNNLIPDALALIEKVIAQQPELYAQEFEYLEPLRVKYYLFRNQPELLHPCLAQFQLEPIRSIDQLLPLMEVLKYYGAQETLVDLCTSVYHQINNSDQLIFNPNHKLAHVIFIDLLSQASQHLQQGHIVDWESLHSFAQQYITGDPQKWLAEIRHDLTTDVELNPQFLADFRRQKQRHRHLRSLSIRFSLYMAAHKQVRFISSQAIWEVVIGFLESRELPSKQLSHPDTYFTFSQQILERYVNDLVRTVIFPRQPEAAALLWGIPYVYDFLLHKHIIPQAIHQQALATTTPFKSHFIQVFGQHLWQYDFVHRWLPPDSLSETDFAAEASLFATSIEIVTPLSEQPSQSLTESLRQYLNEEDLFSEINSNPPQQLNPSPPSPQSKPVKPPKKRKSPLQQAAELLGQDTFSKGKHKKKR